MFRSFCLACLHLLAQPQQCFQKEKTKFPRFVFDEQYANSYYAQLLAS